MSWSDDAPPQLLLAAIGNGRDGYYQVRWQDGALEWSYGDESARLVPTASAWRIFWRAVDRNGVWEWRERYERPGGENEALWVLEIRRPGHAFSSSGANAYPPGPRGSAQRTREFNRFCEAVSLLAGGREFG